MDTIKVYVVAEFEPLRIGLSKTISAAPDMEVIFIAEASTMEQIAEESPPFCGGARRCIRRSHRPR